MQEQRRRFVVSGQVQGVGFRPFVYRMAVQHGLTGTVSNTSEGVFIEVQGPPPAVAAFGHDLVDKLPPLAQVVSCVRSDMAPVAGEQAFVIVASTGGHGHQVLISPDMATCDDCLADMSDPANRRFLYPFTNCTNCGPRYTITRSIPYDRDKTSMACFPLCPECRTEYENPLDRRFHAQPNACPVCGPRLWLMDAAGTRLAEGHEAIGKTARVLSAGGIAAIKGLGGFHLACDATSHDAVALLRRRKHRPHKPLAVMVPDMETVRRIAIPSAEEERLILSQERPIVLCHTRADSPLSPLVAPDTGYIGIMLPYTPLHHVLFRMLAEAPGRAKFDDSEGSIGQPAVAGLADEGGTSGSNPEADVLMAGITPETDRPRAAGLAAGIKPESAGPSGYGLAADAKPGTAAEAAPRICALVMTSGNASSEPICLGNREALRRLASIADTFLLHDRDILIRTDDSVVRAVAGEDAMFLRRARGFVPKPVHLAAAGPCVLGTGPELKNTLCLTRGDMAFVSQHIGDMHNLETLGFYREIAAHLADILQVQPEAVVRDLHPDYMTTHWAEETGLPVLALQHHYAHAHSVLAENRHEGAAICLVLDGTGYGEDGTIWGGEVLLVDTENLDHERLAHFAHIPLPGGEAAIREPWRIAQGMLHSLGLHSPGKREWPWLAQHAEASRMLRHLVERKINTPVTSSCGRLFDAVSALLGLCQTITYEGQAAILLEQAQDMSETCAYPCPVRQDAQPLILDTAQLFLHAYADREAGIPEGRIARRFHLGLAQGLAALADALANPLDIRAIGLSGGVMQNLTLATELPRALRARGLTPLVHTQLPPNDACISLGQAAWGQRKLGAT